MMTKRHKNTIPNPHSSLPKGLAFRKVRGILAGCVMIAGCSLLAGCGKSLPADAGILDVIPIESSMNAYDPNGTDNPEKNADFSGTATEASLDQASEMPSDANTQTLKEPALPSLEKFLRTALLPVGETAYIWGGGWNEEDTAAGIEARSIGVSPKWKAFADGITSDYDTKKTRYQIHDGLDCSGYVGWVAYNTFETEDGKEGYVYSSTKTAETYASFGWGDYLPAKSVKDCKPGDIASMNGHVWISLGTCEDGSVLLVHSSPPGVRLCGTAASKGTSEAVRLATEYMKTYYPDWYSRFPDCESKKTYLEGTSQMRWNEETFPDCKELRAMSPAELLKFLYSEKD